MFVIRHARESLATAAGVALILLVAAAPVDAQELGGQAFRTSLGATLLMPASDFNLQGSYGLASDPERLPSGRAVLEIQANPNFGFHLGALRLAPNVLWDSTSTFGELEEPPRYRVALYAGILGFRLNFTTGRFRIAPYADVGGGQAQARIDPGGQSTQFGYQPGAVYDTASIMVGGGGGLAVDAIIGPGLTLAALGGFYRFQSIETNDAGDPVLDPLKGLFVGGGVKLAFRDATYYWRHSGEDQDPPVIAIQSPTADSDGVVDVGEDRTTLTLRVSDLSNVDSVFVNDTRLRLIPAADVRPEEGRAVLTSVDLALNPGSNSVSYVAFDGAGNRLAGEWEVLGIPLDEEGPVISILQPQDNLSIASDRLMVEAVIRDRSPIEQVTVNGFTVRTQEATDEDRRLVEASRDDFVVRFTNTTNVPSAEFTVSVAAMDSAGNQRLETATVHRADLAQARPERDAPAPAQEVARGPEIEIHTPAEWAGGGTRGLAASPRAAIRVSGLARYQDGIREVLANNKRMAIQRDPSNPSIVQFSGFVDPPSAGSRGEVEILVRGLDGTQTARAYDVQSNPAPAVTNTRAQFAEVADAKNRQRWAVVIGVSDYVDESIGDLQYADDDALAVYDFLRSPAAGMGGIPEDHIRLLINEEATSRNIRSALTTFLRKSTPDDVIFIYIAGHGAPDPYRPDDLYILTHDTELDDIAATAVSMAYAGQAIEEAFAYNKVLFTDACHSGGMGAGTRAMNNNQINSAFLDYMNSSAGGFVTFTASESTQLSQEGEQYGGGHGAFTHFLLEGLSGEADEDGDRIITLGEVMEYTRNAVRRATSNAQVPAISQTTFDRFWPMAAVLVDQEGTEQ